MKNSIINTVKNTCFKIVNNEMSMLEAIILLATVMGIAYTVGKLILASLPQY